MTLRVNGVEIAEQALAREAQYHPASSLEQAREEAARALVVRELLLQQAAMRGLTAGQDRDRLTPAEEEEAITQLLADEIELPEADEETCRRYWANNPRKFRSPDLVEASHILLMAPPEDPEARARAKQKASELIAVLLREPNAFGSMAAEFSRCPSKDQGGRLGQLTRGDTVPELETFLFNLEAGQLCPLPVETRYGFHVVRVDHRVDGKELPFDSVRAKIADFLRDRAWTQAVSHYIRVLAGQAAIEGVELPAATSPLVQ